MSGSPRDAPRSETSAGAGPPPRIHTERLLLRGFEPSDLQPWNELILADPEVTRYLPIDGPLTPDQLTEAAGRRQEHWASHGHGVWAACLAGTGDLIGHCGLRYLDDLAETEVLYGLGRRWWGQGFATEAATAAVGFGFERAGLTRIVAFAVPENRASVRVMEKVGMRFEGEVDVFGLHCARYAIERPDPA